jgi:uncharacterized membrane protein YfcA
MSELFGYLASAFVGITMGLLGGGGSILTIPILVYLFSVSPTLAISYSLFIVGVTSLVGTVNNFRRGTVDTRTALLFGSASVTTVFLTRKFIIPNLPDIFFTIGSYSVTHSMFVMVMFAILMVAASLSMIRNRKPSVDPKNAGKPQVLLAYGILIGLVTGFLGAGGGFLLIPALVLLMRLPMKRAIGTSLFIISFNSLIGFTGDLGRHPIEWKLVLTITAIAMVGIFIGVYFNTRIPSRKLKIAFGWFVLLTGIYIIIRETAG